MKKLLLIIILQSFVYSDIQCQTFTIQELFTLADLPSNSIEHFMKKKGFVFLEGSTDTGEFKATFITKARGKSNPGPKRSIDIDLKDNSKYLTLHFPVLNEYLEGGRRLIKSGFFYDTLKDINKANSILFQKANISIKATSEMKDGIAQYSFELKEKAIPVSIMYAEDLLLFDSHEFLVSFFGTENVKKDMYYLSEKELKKCSVLFSGTRRQVVFVWDDDFNLTNLAYILVTNALPTEGGKKNDPLSGDNEWKLKNGICPGMGLRDLLKINETDFDIYGNKSDLAFLVKPNDYGKIDFKKTAVMLSCHECFDNKIFNQTVVSALEVAKANIPMRIFDVVIYPFHH